MGQWLDQERRKLSYLEQWYHRLPGNTQTRCPTPIYLAWVSEDNSQAGATGVPCKRWRCSECGKGKRAEALKLIRAIAATGQAWDPRQPLRLITLTRPRAKPNDLSDRDDCRRASEDVRELIKAWRRGGRTLEYARVLERTKRGRIHVHLLVWGHYVAKCSNRGRRARGLPTGPGSGSPCYCSDDRPCLQRLAWAHGWGWVDVRHPRCADCHTRGRRRCRHPEGVVGYVAKYLTKASDETWPRHARRLSYSRAASGGLTLGLIHEGWIAQVHAQRQDATHNDAGHVIDRHWIGHVPRYFVRCPEPPRAPPPEGQGIPASIERGIPLPGEATM